MPQPDLDTLRRAYAFAEEAHAGQMRRSGEPYIIHPLATAHILAELQLDTASIVAGLLHDVPEDTGRPVAYIQQQFGDEVAALVDGVTKLSRIDWQALEESKRRVQKQSADEVNAWAENLRKMFLAMAEDVRVVLIKLADRLHNMRTLIYLPAAKRRQIAQETMEIYAPLANRLGIWQMKWQMEDLAFRHLEPAKYKELAGLLASRRDTRERYVARVISILREELGKAGLKAEVSGRPKHIYSIYRKMQKRGVDFSQIYDLLAVRVIVEEVADCYSALGVVHSLWRPMPGQFDDYIAMPKESLYQSLHTSVIGPDGSPLEVQIRTHQMHRLAEYGVAAHWRYKEGGKRDSRFEEKVAWLRQLLDWQKEVAGGAVEFVESLKTDIFQDQVYVFTPKGEIKELPAGATPLDFAYRIHTDIGHRCLGAKVNGRLVALDTALRNGDIIEVLTSKAPKGPSRDWLNPSLGFIKTSHARDKIRQWFRHQQRDENIVRGRELLEKDLARLGLAEEKLEEIAKQFKYEKLDDFLAAIGYGDINTQQIAMKLVAAAQQEEERLALPTVVTPPTPSGIKVMGVGDLLTRLASCCHPVPGDPIIGYITRGKGVTIHRADCHNVVNEDERERLVHVEWGRVGEMSYPVTVRIEALDREGLLRDVATIVAESKMNMVAASAQVHEDRTATITSTVQVNSIDKLTRLMSKLEGIRDVYSVQRVMESQSRNGK
ncbi:MAG: bifunctional (p)ppGpp synthetase/guanosine-3',5'-bis(diphosphate) 3'-pyrophosphohydrolase [Chloroflexi bacterium]|nr:bifunctional (p)ppGpp synthetase/guanosine-3',5'-bis(diphosphate) 3'-pyrophosphohydrolase [Chloroflexota bacterium]MCL5107666.1 bifunctional (p)ppGpp synthetase/guanosine-3',5'-bis(diphosphate) 3'-pyrophosphohydrolase [Chloroflexota bacterium]